MLETHLLRCLRKEERTFEGLFRNCCSLHPLLNCLPASPNNLKPKVWKSVPLRPSPHIFLLSGIWHVSTWSKSLCLCITCKYQKQNLKAENKVSTRPLPQLFIKPLFSIPLCQSLSLVKEIQSWIPVPVDVCIYFQFSTFPFVLLTSKFISLSLTTTPKSS